MKLLKKYWKYTIVLLFVIMSVIYNEYHKYNFKQEVMAKAMEEIRKAKTPTEIETIYKIIEEQRNRKIQCREIIEEANSIIDQNKERASELLGFE